MGVDDDGVAAAVLQSKIHLVAHQRLQSVHMHAQLKLVKQLTFWGI